MKTMILLSINSDYFPHFYGLFNPYRNDAVSIVNRKGIELSGIANCFNNPDIIDNQFDIYKIRVLRKSLTNRHFDRSFILCRYLDQNIEYFYNVIIIAFEYSDNIYLMDIKGGLRKLNADEIFQLRMKHVLAFLVGIPSTFYRAYSYITVFLISLILLLVTPLLRTIRKIYFYKNILRVCIAKRVHSNQSYIIKKGLEELGLRVTTVNFIDHPHNSENNKYDIEIDLPRINNPYLRFGILSLSFAYCSLKTDIMLFENNGESFLVSPLFENWGVAPFFQKIELFLYKVMGIKTIFEMRDCTAYNRQKGLSSIRRSRCKHCCQVLIKANCGNEPYKYVNKTAINYADKIIYSTIDLKDHLPDNAEWLPNAYIPEDLHSKQANHNELMILHYAKHELMKGTDIVKSVVESLKKKYDFMFFILQNMSHEDAMKYIRNCDIVLGQFNVGTYGNFEIECMMNAKPVIGYINPDYLNLFPLKPPLLMVDENDIEKSIYFWLEKLILDKELRFKKGKEAIEYALRVHSYKNVAQKLSNIMLNLIQDKN